MDDAWINSKWDDARERLRVRDLERYPRVVKVEPVRDSQPTAELGRLPLRILYRITQELDFVALVSVSVWMCFLTGRARTLALIDLVLCGAAGMIGLAILHRSLKKQMAGPQLPDARLLRGSSSGSFSSQVSENSEGESG